MNTEGILQKLPIFSSLTDKELKIVCNTGTSLSVDSDEILFSEGDEGSNLFIVLKGSIRYLPVLQIMLIKR